MSNVLSVVEAYLDQAGVARARDEGEVVFSLQVGGLTLACAVWSEREGQLALSAVDDEGVAAGRIAEAQAVLERLVAAGDGSGQTLLNKKNGWVLRRASVDVSMTPPTPRGIGQIFDHILCSFAEKLKLMRQVLVGELTAEEAVRLVAAAEEAARAERTTAVRRFLHTAAAPNDLLN